MWKAGLRQTPWVYSGLFLLQSFCSWSVASAEQWNLNEKAVLRTASVADGRATLSKTDLFIKMMSPFDLAVRLKTAEPTSPEAYLRQSAAQVEDFTVEDQQHLQAAMEILLPKLAAWKLPWPKEVLLIKTSAEHESGAAYCRGPVIVLPESRITPNAEKLAKLLAHELFHVLSNQNPEFRKQLYALVGFKQGGPVRLPKSLDDRRITNPDAPTLTDYAMLKIGDREAAMVPILIAEPAKFDPSLKKGMFGYLKFRLLEVTPTGTGLLPVLDDGVARLHPVSSVPDYMEKIGNNTKYIIHPEEVLAENFVLLMFKAADVPTPELLEKMAGVLERDER